jgi:hypothetical protein
MQELGRGRDALLIRPNLQAADRLPRTARMAILALRTTKTHFLSVSSQLWLCPARICSAQSILVGRAQPILGLFCSVTLRVRVRWPRFIPKDAMIAVSSESWLTL